MTIFFAPLRLAPRPTEPQESLWKLVLEVTPIQWGFYLVGWLAWTCDAMDFFSVSLSVTPLSAQFGRDTTEITQAITLTLLFRSVGAILFGILSDRFGRKWPLVFNLILVAVLSLGAGFCNTYQQFLAARSLFGIAMGGIWGLSASTALENLPVGLRGIASGWLQQGYSVGYLLAACISLKLVPAVRPGWRSLFWTAAGVSAFAALLRALLPESAVFQKARQAAEKHGVVSERDKTKVFLHETKQMLKSHWLLVVYMILLMTGFNFLAHGSQDLFPTYLEKTKGFSAHDATIATIISNCGAISGGFVAGYLSQYLGRRITIIIFLLLSGAFIPLWILPSSFGALAAGAFCVQFGVEGAWGVIPIHITELAPPAFRVTFPGVAYQIGNMVSSASAQIEATGAAHLTTMLNGTVVPDYAKVQGIFIGCITAFTVLVTFIGPENHSSRFEKHRAAFDQGGGSDEAYIEEEDHEQSVDVGDKDSQKASEERIEQHKSASTEKVPVAV